MLDLIMILSEVDSPFNQSFELLSHFLKLSIKAFEAVKA